jgi:glyoxylase-like metal-dependent hydrolase (beta-lactamase superfamily II)
VFIASFPAGAFQTNCYLAADAPGSDCVVIDPGLDAIEGVRELIMEYDLKPVAVMITHGHVDHMFSVTPLCTAYQSVCWVHAADRELLADPYRAMSAEMRTMLVQLTGGRSFTEPDEVRELSDGDGVSVAGLEFRAIHAPGHTPGSVMFTSAYQPQEHGAPGGSGGVPPGMGTAAEVDIDTVLFSGDVLFAGAIGRTDLPGGSWPDMLRSLRTKVLPLPDTVAVLPGHGPQTTMARERVANPYLQERNLVADDSALS